MDTTCHKFGLSKIKKILLLNKFNKIKVGIYDVTKDLYSE